MPVDLVHTIASFALHRASRWLVEPCRCLGPLSRSGTLIALTSQWSASCLSVNHAMFAVECLNHQTSEAKSVWRDGSFTTSTPSSRGISSGTSRAAWPVWRSKMYIQPKQADGLWSRVDALDPCRGLMSTHCRPSRTQKTTVSEWSTGCISVDPPYLLSRISIINQSGPCLFGVMVFAPGSLSTLTMRSCLIKYQDVTRVYIEAKHAQ